ncbi:MAG TPA: alpha-2-macroglobulin family protein [Spirochaetota bacterium]|jgi:hypothetical protein|nr:MAG: MG2 domain protein [Spirochaetes bacterium ADurb.Bin133]HPY88119.1 alpha-2-macroglobulin family protein [Spirochaetota bacterium]HQB60378.1 alpha-2-macroglobulin family protein [Spirochaetota bacterium]
MRIKFLFILFFLFALVCCKVSNDTSNNNDVPTTPAYKGEYEDMWNKIIQLENRGLTKQALDETAKLLKTSIKDKKSPQIIKSLIYSMKYRSILEENIEETLLNEVEELAKSESSPTKEILYSVLAEMYTLYLDANYYNIISRSITADADPKKMQFWDAEKFSKKIWELYDLSLQNKEVSKKIKITDFKDILSRGYKSEEVRPFLYDFLAHRAIDYFTNGRSCLTEPAYKFEIDDKKYFADAASFKNLKIETKDETSRIYKTLLLFQDTIGFHINDKTIDALTDLDLKRISYVYTNSVVEDKESLYLARLENIAEKSKKSWIYPEIICKIAEKKLLQASKYDNDRNPDYKNVRLNVYKALDEAQKLYPKDVGASRCLSIMNNLKNKEVKLTIEKATIPDVPFLAYINYRNVSKLYFKILPISEAKAKEIERKNYDNESMLNLLNGVKPVKEWEQALIDDNDFNYRSLELEIPGLPIGLYYVCCSANPEYSKNENAVFFAPVQITRLSYIEKNNPCEKNYELYVLDRDTGLPIEGALVETYYQRYNQIKSSYENVRGKSYKTDKSGLAIINSEKNSNYLAYNISKGDDKLSSKEYRYFSSNENVVLPRISTHFFTDRSIYRPGQTVYYKGVVVESFGKSNKILTNKAVSVIFYDVNWQKIDEQTLTTNEFGTISGSFVSPVGRLTGAMTIYASDGTGAASISVEEYKRPKFEVEFIPIKESYKVGDQVEVVGLAKSYSGAFVDGAAVKYRVVRKTRLPYWRWYWGVYPAIADQQIVNGESKTDENGEFKVKFDAIPDKSISKENLPIFNYLIYADVTDINGETRSSQTTVNVGYAALNLSIDVPEVLYKDKGAAEFDINSYNLDGEFVSAKGQIAIYRLKNPDNYYRERAWAKPQDHILTETEFHSKFKLDMYDDENNFYLWPKDVKVFDEKFDTGVSKKTVFNSISNVDSGKYILTIKSQDKFGKTVEIEKYFTITSKSEKTLPYPALGYANFIDTRVEPGENFSFEIGSSAKEVNILLEIESDKKIVKKEFIKLNSEKKLINIPVIEDYRGNFVIHAIFTKHNRNYNWRRVVYVPWSNKELDIKFETFRDKLRPGEKEEWRLRISGKNRDKIASEMVATLYDASLNAFKPHDWYFNIFQNYYPQFSWGYKDSFGTANFNDLQFNWNKYVYARSREYSTLDWFNYYFGSGGYRIYTKSRSRDSGRKYAMKTEESAMESLNEVEGKEDYLAAPSVADSEMLEDKPEPNVEKREDSSGAESKFDAEEMQIRTNFNETAFFYPHLKTNDKGEIIVSFTIPESLTKWRMLGFAHSKELEYGFIEKTLVTQKDLMLVPNIPRFLRENDKITLTSKITNLSETALSGTAELELLDVTTMKPINEKFGNSLNKKPFTAKAGLSVNVEWTISIPEGIDGVTYRIVARADRFSDGEESTLPILVNRTLVTESLPLPIRKKGTKEMKFTKLIESAKSDTLAHERVTLEFTSNPVWYAVQALPYMMEYPYECLEQTFSRLYSNGIASHIANSDPLIKDIFESWKNTDALLSNLEKNEELKNVLLEESPWLRQAKDESSRKKMMGTLFDLKRMKEEINKCVKKLEEGQLLNGGFAWFKGLPEDRYITQHIIAGFGHLKKLNITNITDNNKISSMIKKAIPYLDNKMKEDYDYLIKNKANLSDDNIGYTQMHYLYMRSFFNDIPVGAFNKKSYDYWMDQAKKYWLNKSLYMKGLLALALYRNGEKTTANDIIKSLKENCIVSDELGMYWKENVSSYYWYQAPIETQAVLIEAFLDVANDLDSVEDMKAWLLKQKQTGDWKTTKATSEACYALLLQGNKLITDDSFVKIELGSIVIDPANDASIKTESGTGYLKMIWDKDKIFPDMGNVKLTKKTDGVSWGALYWQYFEQLDKITSSETNVKINKKLFVERKSDRGPIIEAVTDKTKLAVGDLIKVRIEITTDRNMEYVHLKDARSSAFEPTNVLSGYKYRDGLWYYEATKDASTNFFIPWLVKGSYVFEYSLRITHKGNFSNGITTLQCMYAPEFTSNSEGVRVTVE